MQQDTLEMVCRQTPLALVIKNFNLHRTVAVSSSSSCSIIAEKMHQCLY